MDNLGVSAGSESTFLPFRGGGARFHNFALLTELLGFVMSGMGIDELLDFVGDNVLDTLALQDLYLLSHWDGLTWKVTGPKTELNEFITLAPEHAVATALESGAIGLASTDGWAFELDQEAQGLPQDSYRLLLVPLIDNLVPRSVLVAVIANSGPISPAEQELFTFLQVVVSFTAYGSNFLDQKNYDF